jgi:hypothetical protein
VTDNEELALEVEELNAALNLALSERDEWHRQNGLLRGELEAARAEIERQRAEREALAAGYDMRGHEIAELRRGRGARQAGLRAELEQRQAAPILVVGGGCEGCGCCSRQGCHRFADATCPTDSLGDSVCPCTED